MGGKNPLQLLGERDFAMDCELVFLPNRKIAMKASQIRLLPVE
jgi:hypothetical protein